MALVDPGGGDHAHHRRLFWYFMALSMPANLDLSLKVAHQLRGDGLLWRRLPFSRALIRQKALALVLILRVVLHRTAKITADKLTSLFLRHSLVLYLSLMPWPAYCWETSPGRHRRPK